MPEEDQWTRCSLELSEAARKKKKVQPKWRQQLPLPGWQGQLRGRIELGPRTMQG